MGGTRDGNAGDMIDPPPCPNCQQRKPGLGHHVELMISLQLEPPFATHHVPMIALDGWVPFEAPATDRDGQQLRIYRLGYYANQARAWGRRDGEGKKVYVMARSKRRDRKDPRTMTKLPVVVQCFACAQYARVDPPPGLDS